LAEALALKKCKVTGNPQTTAGFRWGRWRFWNTLSPTIDQTHFGSWSNSLYQVLQDKDGVVVVGKKVGYDNPRSSPKQKR